MKTVVVGTLNTDIVASGVKVFPKTGQHVYADKITIGPGGKSRNVAQMIAVLSEPKSVAMVGVTVKDKFNLWKPPLEALESVAVDTSYVTILQQSDKLPGIAFIGVNTNGDNQIYAAMGIADELSKEHIDKAMPLFEEVAKDNGFLVLTLELPIAAAEYAASLARKLGIKILLDPGGIRSKSDLKGLSNLGVYLLKPNEHEAKILTGVDVIDLASAKKAAELLHQQKFENILITTGEDGAYLFTESGQKHIAIPEVKASGVKDATGCGDQTLATLCAGLQDGITLDKAVERAILAGTLQFHKPGIQPITKQELETN